MNSPECAPTDVSPFSRRIALSRCSGPLKSASDSFRLPASGRLGFPFTKVEVEVPAPQRADLLTNSSYVAVDALSHGVTTLYESFLYHEAAILKRV